MSNILIEANNISKIYDPDLFLKTGKNFHALHQVDFVLEKGDFVSVMGPSGSGKSTLLNCISGLDTISRGSLTIFDKPVSTLKDKELSTFRYKYLGYIFQNHNLISTLSIYDNIAAPIMLDNQDPKKINERIQELAERLKIKDILQKNPSKCSGGEKQRAAIARALVNNPKIVVCDEPTGNLDSVNSHEVLSILTELNEQGISIVLVTHDNMIASYAKRFMYLRDGQIHTVLKRGQADQETFFNEIVKITTQDSLFKMFKRKTGDEVKENSPSNMEVEKVAVDNSGKLRLERVYAIFENREEDPNTKKYRPIIIGENEMKYTSVTHEEIVIAFKNIVNVKLILKPNFRNFGIFSEYEFFTQMLIKTKESKYFLMFMNPNDLTPLFDKLSKYTSFEDPIGIQKIYKEYPDRLRRTRYLQSQLKRLKKEFGIKL